MVILNVRKMRLFFLLIGLPIIFANSSKVNDISSTIHKEDLNKLDCENGTLLSSSVCVPEGYLKGEAPGPNTVVNTIVEIDSVREINDKKMRIILDYYQECAWIDNRIRTRFPSPDQHQSVLNNNLVGSIWKPDLWIHNLFEFELISVLEPTGGLIIKEEYNESNSSTKGDIKRNTLVAVL